MINTGTNSFSICRLKIRKGLQLFRSEAGNIKMLAHITISNKVAQNHPTISDNNIGQWLPFPPYPLPNVVLQVQKNIERKVDIIVATLKEGKRGRAFF